ncbi:MAG: sugar phosphate isomerase/epimerase family protein [Puniceicoccales bacterium]
MENIRIGTLAGKGADTPAYIKSLLPYGFESFQINFWQRLGDVNLEKLAEETKSVLDGSGAIVSSIGVFGNPLESEELDKETLASFEQAIDHAHLFGTDIVAGFTGRLRGKSIPDSIGRFKEVWSDLAARAKDRGVRIAFENCSMGGDWNTGDFNIAHSPDAWELMFDALPADNIGLEWEPCHQMIQLIDPMPQLRDWIDRIFHVHGKDATILHDVVAKHGIGGAKDFAYHRTPGFGDSNWTDIISMLRLGGYQGTIDIEGWHDPVYKGDLEITGQVHALNYLKRCRGGDIITL